MHSFTLPTVLQAGMINQEDKTAHSFTLSAALEAEIKLCITRQRSGG